MDNKGQLTVGAIVILMMGIFAGLAIFGEVVDQQSKLTDLQTVADETTNLTAVSCYTAGGEVNESSANCNITVDNWYPAGDWRASESQCYISSVTVSNATGTALTLSTDYTVDSDAGVITMLNTTDTNQTGLGENVLVDYSYCAEGYNKDSGSRGIARTISLFAAMALLAFAGFYVFKEYA